MKGHAAWRRWWQRIGLVHSCQGVSVSNQPNQVLCSVLPVLAIVGIVLLALLRKGPLAASAT